MQELGDEQSGEVSVVEEPGADHPATAPASREEPPRERAELSSEGAELLAEVQRLEAELERYRAHAERTSKLFLSATNYAEWVRENARRDAELALRKARAKVEKLDRTARELERTEHELARAQGELARLQTLTDETRARLSAFLTAGLEVLNSELAAGQDDSPDPELGDLQDTLQEQLASTSVSTPGLLAEVERPER